MTEPTERLGTCDEHHTRHYLNEYISGCVNWRPVPTAAPSHVLANPAEDNFLLAPAPATAPPSFGLRWCYKRVPERNIVMPFSGPHDDLCSIEAPHFHETPDPPAPATPEAPPAKPAVRMTPDEVKIDDFAHMTFCTTDYRLAEARIAIRAAMKWARENPADSPVGAAPAGTPRCEDCERGKPIWFQGGIIGHEWHGNNLIKCPIVYAHFAALASPSAPAQQNWRIEVGPVETAVLGDYMDVAYSLMDGGDRFKVVQRVEKSKAGHAKAYARIERIIGRPSAPAPAPQCNHRRCIGPVACPVNTQAGIGVWRWLFCERCHAIKEWRDDLGQTAENVEWKHAPSAPAGTAEGGK